MYITVKHFFNHKNLKKESKTKKVYIHYQISEAKKLKYSSRSIDTVLYLE